MKFNRVQIALLFAAAGFIALSVGSGRRASDPVTVGRRGESPRGPEAVPTRPGERADGSRVSEMELVSEIRRFLTDGGEERANEALTTMLPELTRRNPVVASGLCESLEAGPVRDRSLRVLMAAWTSQDAQESLKWAARLQDPGEREFALAEGYLEVGRHDPRKALEMLERDDPSGGSATAGGLIRIWAASDLCSAREWLEAHPSAEPETDERWAAFAEVLVSRSPSEAATAVAGIFPGAVQDEAVVAVLHQWALRDPAGAAGWIDLFPPGALRTRAENELAGVSKARAAR
jgi:hypothetical protein